jgi:threonylcarbamoyladenosine tRNA methylthiotransferase MtaB
VPLGAVAEQVRALVADGYARGGADRRRPHLLRRATCRARRRSARPCRRLLAVVPDLPRLRLSSLDPVEVDDDLSGA